jgi:hypothetical protein
MGRSGGICDEYRQLRGLVAALERASEGAGDVRILIFNDRTRPVLAQSGRSYANSIS